MRCLGVDKMENRKEITLKILLTREQKNILEAKAMSYGFRSKGEFARFMLFSPSGFIEKVNDMHKKICGQK